ncbi:putative nucleosome assembly protein [Leptomonas pyrrhocoris]|uniref:Putative nucleosome assembly protein n=1 Tax=Leptomonas pyrrhocoris TaxID=157538 RepID=A0A0N0DX77_LEPPY|nr:putative nucleosome assembly protein [Leptomonas pyrrhocoris]XP_015661103.1 putative nucleosome assembly protein [Leptomonas pyrrhocoris]XP_015661104.1 putative nucleosome assembly protein [Leptomonas pyrrhocoris]KPA82663.1 putative nucleosome assembly protein [Leptomonas pyrrhocoris]KPA82664.1 putative nucleosome assembly protein [Leptomonas pyrrhocoris]KPA82665.1 putative nucleosome assembly protein [Leptomonas pyrrhocoris]|eukprot:XP_015661102.1 putative nucleosome assembly protein [Leptomonas pyrrhocoris]
MPPKHHREPVVMPPVEDEEDDMMDMDMGMTDFQKYLDPDFSKNFMASLPEKIRQRAQVLSAYNEDYLAVQKACKDKETAILRRYDALFAPLLQRRQEIVTGAAVTDEEVRKGMPAEHEEQVSVEMDPAASSEDVKGLEGFWLRVLQHHVVIGSTIEEHDEDALRHLVDVKSFVAEGDYGSFQVAFTFSPNDYFEEETITVAVAVKDTDSKLTLPKITWKPGKNLTMRTISKKQRAKRTGQTRTITREVPQPSFFWLFCSKAEVDGEDDEEDEEDGDDDEQRISTLEVLHTCVIPNAVRYFTGEAPDGCSDADEDEEEEEEEEEEEIQLPRGRGGRGGRGGHGGGRGGRGGRGN